MSFAETFMKQLKEGNTTEAISTLQNAIKENTQESIEETRNNILESYGFSESKEEKEKGEDEDDETEEEEEETDDEE